MKPEVLIMACNILHPLVPTTFQIAFATKPLPPFASITATLGEIYQASFHLEFFILLFSLLLKLFIQIFTEVTLLPSVSHQFI